MQKANRIEETRIQSLDDDTANETNRTSVFSMLNGKYLGANSFKYSIKLGSLTECERMNIWFIELIHQC